MALNSSSSPDIKLWKSARGFKTHLRLREILQDHFMSDWNRCPLTSLVQALAAHHIILYVAGWLRIIWPKMGGVISYFCWGPLLPSYDQCVSDFAFWCLDSLRQLSFDVWAQCISLMEGLGRAAWQDPALLSCWPIFLFFFHSFWLRVLCSEGDLMDLILRNFINEIFMYLSKKIKTLRQI